MDKDRPETGQLKAILGRLADAELNYVLERSKVHSNAQACKNAGLSESAFYRWDKERRAALNAYAQQLRRNRAIAAELVLIEAAEEAARVLIDSLQSDSDAVKRGAAKEILDRTAGKAAQHVEGSAKHDHTVKGYTEVSPDDWDADEDGAWNGTPVEVAQ